MEEARRGYQPDRIIDTDADLARVMDLLECGHFNLLEAGIFEPIIAAVRSPSDPWMTAADFRSYIDCQRRVDNAFADSGSWARMSILNTAASGRFSSDRTISEYRDEIWFK